MEEKLRCFLDGNSLCIVKEDFVDIQESEAFFIELTPEVLEDFKDFEKGILCKFCKTTETGLTQDGKSRYVKHKIGCNRPSTSTGL